MRPRARSRVVTTVGRCVPLRRLGHFASAVGVTYLVECTAVRGSRSFRARGEAERQRNAYHSATARGGSKPTCGNASDHAALQACRQIAGRRRAHAQDLARRTNPDRQVDALRRAAECYCVVAVAEAVTHRGDDFVGVRDIATGDGSATNSDRAVVFCRAWGGGRKRRASRVRLYGWPRRLLWARVRMSCDGDTRHAQRGEQHEAHKRTVVPFGVAAQRLPRLVNCPRPVPRTLSRALLHATRPPTCGIPAGSRMPVQSVPL